MPAWLGIDYRTAAQAAQRFAEASAAGAAAVADLSPSVVRAAEAMRDAPHLAGIPIIFNLPAFLIVMLVTYVLVRGISESAWFNTAMVVLKLAIIAFFVLVGAFYVKPENWTPFAPNGFAGISGAAAIIFFAYIGFDAVSTAAEETKNPQRDMPIGMIASLVVCTMIYIVVALVLTGMVPYKELGTAEPLATAFSALGMHWTAGIISLGAVFATTSVLVVFQLGQPRIFFSMARDGLLPPWAARVHPKYRTPHITTILTGVFVATFAAVANIDEIVQLTNIGTLFAFVLVAIGILDSAEDESERAAPVSYTFRAGGAAAGGAVLRLPDAPAPLGNLGPVHPVAGARAGVLLRVWGEAQRAARRQVAWLPPLRGMGRDMLEFRSHLWPHVSPRSSLSLSSP